MTRRFHHWCLTFDNSGHFNIFNITMSIEHKMKAIFEILNDKFGKLFGSVDPEKILLLRNKYLLNCYVIYFEIQEKRKSGYGS